MAFEDEDEYEIIPTSPVRRIEKRIDKLEQGSYPNEVRKLIEQVVELIKSNQKIIDDSIRANNELRAELSKIPDSITNLVNHMNDFMKLLEESATEEAVSDVSKEVMQPLLLKLTELVDQNKKSFEASQASLATLDMIEKRLKRVFMQPPMMGSGSMPPAAPPSMQRQMPPPPQQYR
jgi:predicted transcriptional regulator